MIDGASRKKRKDAQLRQQGGDGGVRPDNMSPHGTTDGDDWEQAGGFTEAGPGGFEPPVPVVPGEVWEELARGEERQPTPPSSYDQAVQSLIEPGPPLIEERYDAETMARYPVVVRREVAPVFTPPETAVRPHEDEPPHEHAIAPDVWRVGGDLAAPTSSGESDRKKSARDWLGDSGQGVAHLRRAVVLHEIFGPPVSLRGSDDSN
jgi:hypothetical protein